MTCTIGVAQADFAKDKNAEALKKHAEEALRNGKDAHRNVVAVRRPEERSTSYTYLSLGDPERKELEAIGRYDHNGGGETAAVGGEDCASGACDSDSVVTDGDVGGDCDASGGVR